jgi:hypothetical protein
MSAGRAPRRATSWPSSCCATAGSIARARRRGRSSIAPGCAASSSIIRSRSARSSTPARTWTRWTRSWPRSTLSWRGSPRRCRGAIRCVGYRTALGLLAEIGDWRRFAHPRELAAYLGLVPSEYSSGEQRHRGHITKTGNTHARRLLIEAAWHYARPPRRRPADPELAPELAARAWQAQVRLHQRHRNLTEHGKRSTVATVAVARELAGFLWAAMTQQPLRETEAAAA